MPIETDIPMEIETYRKKLLFGLTGRPLLAVGFLRPQGVSFEEFLYLQLRRYTWPSRLPYEAETEHIREIRRERGDPVGDHGHAEKADKTGATGECTYRYRQSTGRRRKHRREARRAIRAACREARAARRRARREARRTRAQKHG